MLLATSALKIAQGLHPDVDRCRSPQSSERHDSGLQAARATVRAYLKDELSCGETIPMELSTIARLRAVGVQDKIVAPRRQPPHRKSVEALLSSFRAPFSGLSLVAEDWSVDVFRHNPAPGSTPALTVSDQDVCAQAGRRTYDRIKSMSQATDPLDNSLSGISGLGRQGKSKYGAPR